MCARALRFSCGLGRVLGWENFGRLSGSGDPRTGSTGSREMGVIRSCPN